MLKELTDFLGNVGATAKSGRKAVRVGKRAIRNFNRLDDEGRKELGKSAITAALHRVASDLTGPVIRVVGGNGVEDVGDDGE